MKILLVAFFMLVGLTTHTQKINYPALWAQEESTTEKVPLLLKENFRKVKEEVPLQKTISQKESLPPAMKKDSSKNLRILEGKASFYHNRFNGRQTANGERFSNDSLTAAHKSLPFGTQVMVIHGNDTIKVRINDRGPFIQGRIIDLSERAFQKIAPLSKGVIGVKVIVL